MNRSSFIDRLQDSFETPLRLEGNLAVLDNTSEAMRQQQTNDAFSEKWQKHEGNEEKEKLHELSRRWYLTLYGFESEADLRTYLRDCKVVLDAGCGVGYKAAWFAELAPQTLVIGMDYSQSAPQAARTYDHVPNLFFVQGDIAATRMRNGSVDYVNCDQVIMHTEDPERTFAELARIAAAPQGEVACYFYAKKALPRELLDDYFRQHCANISHQDLWEMSEQLTELGKRLSELNATFEAPAIPMLGIKGGRYDVQRFLYWNFLKCYWNPDLGRDNSVVTNFDWYSPSNARRFSEEEVRNLVTSNRLDVVHFHAEEACYSGRFKHSAAARTGTWT